MHRFFIKNENVKDNQLVINNSVDYNHIVNALRLEQGDEMLVCDENKMEYLSVIENICDDHINLTIKEQAFSTQESPLDIDLFQGLPKSKKMDLIVEKNVELGINKIYPVLMKRSIAKIKNKKKEKKKLNRWNKIAKAAAKQSKRGYIPSVEPPIKLQTFEEIKDRYDLIVVPYENEESSYLKTLIGSLKKVKKIAVLIGPEGGFAEEEIEFLMGLEAKTISLGRRILRTETAGVVLTSLLQYELGDLGEKYEK